MQRRRRSVLRRGWTDGVIEGERKQMERQQTRILELLMTIPTYADVATRISTKMNGKQSTGRERLR
jgi:hypothetical protein